MTDEELNREIERAQRNAKKLAALQASNEHARGEMAAVLGNPNPTREQRRHHPAAVRA